jgi:hypothetical protein
VPILDIQHRFRELGRIRTGFKEDTGRVSKKTGKAIMRPVKLPRFRLTSVWQHLIEQAAEEWGGEPRPWVNEGSREWEVYIEADVIEVLVPPGTEVLSQWYELWEGGGLVKRCDGYRQTLVDRPCSCPPDPIVRQDAAAKGQACKATTRLRVMLPALADVGTWRLETHGYHAATELASSAEIVEWATRQGVIVPADLSLVHREGSRRPGQPRHTFYVPALGLRGRLGAVLEALGAPVTDTPVRLAGVEARPALTAGGPTELPPATTNRLDPLEAVEDASLPGPPPAPPPEPPPIDPPAPEGPPPGPPPDAALDVPDVVDTPTPDAFDPPPAPVDEHDGARLTGPQIVAMAFQNRGITDRAHRLAIVSAMIGRPIDSGNELRPSEIRAVLADLGDESYVLPAVAEVVEALPAPAPSRTLGHRTPPPPAPDPAPAGDLDVTRAGSWAPEHWRAYLAGAGVKVLEFFAEVRRLAAELDEAAPNRLEDLTEVSPSLVGLACSWVEDRAAARRGPA